MNKQRLALLGAILASLILIPLAWYLLSPLFRNEQVDEPFPTPVAGLRPAAEGTATMEAARAVPDDIMDESMPVEDTSTLTVLAQGSFYSVAHDGRGSAKIYQLEDGSRLLRFENFMVLNGPELHVYLVPSNPVPNTTGQEIPGSVDLGRLKGNVGDQNYILPADLDLTPFNSVVIWCQPFAVPFIAAPLSVTE
ncbi:MAG: DM13 domain-containing protein [Ardenticatenales bacterium]|nr:DM13 domain-containing protein [Ardenticatenales bacterium]